MRYSVSDTAEHGDYTAGPRIVTDETVSYTHLRAHETVLDLVCRLLLDKKKTTASSRRLYLLQET